MAGKIKVGILTVSDSCSKGEAIDLSGPLLKELVLGDDKLNGEVVATECVPDNIEDIRKVLVSWSDTNKADVILTTGGTGFAARDVTPEATSSILDKQAPGLVTAMLVGSLAVTPLAALSRPAAGIRGSTIIVNLPGSKKAVKECFGFIQPALRHAVDLLQDRSKPVVATHAAMQGNMARSHVCPHQVQGSKNHDTGDGSGGVAGRPRQSTWPMISVQEAQALIFSECQKLIENVRDEPTEGMQVLGTEVVGYREALGRVLCQDVVAKDPLPPFPASIKDGYAVIAQDGAGVRKVKGEASAGCDPSMGVLATLEVVRINTGAPVPPGADAVVMVEETKLVKKTEDGKEELEIEILKAPEVGQDIRPVGSDIALGETVLSKGTILGPGEVGLLAAVGVTQVVVSKLPRVAVLSTGNEIQEPGEELQPGHIRDSNKTTLLALLASNCVNAADAGIAKDDLENLTKALQIALERCDVLVTTGGVSMGDRDLLRQVLVSKFGAEIHFARVQMKPGKPTTFATCVVNNEIKLIIGLPGNPVSATVTCHLYVLPTARLLAGYTSPLPGKVRARLMAPAGLTLDPRPEYIRVQLSFKPGSSVAEAIPTGNQISSRLASMANANGLLILPAKSENMKVVPVGYETDALLIGNILVNL